MMLSKTAMVSKTNRRYIATPEHTDFFHLASSVTPKVHIFFNCMPSMYSLKLISVDTGLAGYILLKIFDLFSETLIFKCGPQGNGY